MMAGGCALNSVANGKIFDLTPFEETFIQPASGDDGLALGSALYVSNRKKDQQRWVMTHPYLGGSFTDEEILLALEKYEIRYTKLERQTLLEDTAKAIGSGNIIGWFQGKMEWGPRALGNRSILAHPGLPDMKALLNSRIKYREPFRPFAPAVLDRCQKDLFDHSQPSPFMLHVYKIRPEWRERLCAVNHVDNTGRLQTISKEMNELFFDLITEFFKLTGIPVLLNTSFNENEPIVYTPDQAIKCFLRTKMDVLVIGSFFCAKPATSN
jgi:carbamoyltransferase